MAKFTTDYVNLIANNLRDRYKTGFPVLKELVQNADDARATSLTFGYHKGHGDAVDHQLLAGPALWVLNNGRFTAQDRQAIMSFGLNSKAAESGAIGKFGLGMKSVFHLCEAFFYVASDGSHNFEEILSPWFQDSGSNDMHRRWEEISQRDLKALNATAAEHLAGRENKSWFMLWVPLRRKTHVPQAEGQLTAPIIDRFPGDDIGGDLDLFTEPDIERRVGRLLPLLRNLQRISFVGTDLLPAFDLKVELHEGSQRLDHVTDGLQARGSVADSGPTGSRLHFIATQTVKADVAPFNRLQASDRWPKSNAIVEDGRRAPVPDKAQPEGAVVFSHADKRRGHLTLQWAVFLPTEEGRYRYEAHIPDSSREYSVTLHGQFFVDAGRRGIDGMELLAEPAADESRQTTEASVHLAWNQALAQHLALPAVLPGLANYVEVAALSDVQVTALTDALVRCATAGDSDAKITFVQAYQRHLCSQHSWVRTLRAEGARWELTSADAKFLLLPRPVGNDHSRPWRAVPGLLSLGEFTFIDSQAPRICRPTSFWDETLVESALNQLPSETLVGEVELKYLVDFLSLHKDRALNTSRVQRQLVSQIRSALQQVPLSDVRRHRQLIKQLAGFLPATMRFGLGTRSVDAKGAVPELLYRQLLAADTEALLLPADLSPDGDIDRPSRADISAWLVQLDKLVLQDPENSPALEIAESLLKAVGGEEAQAELLRIHPTLRILRATDVRANREVATSLQDLCTKQTRGLVFRSTNPKDPLGLTKQLSLAVTSLEVHVVRAYVGNLLRLSLPNGSSDLPSTDDSCAVFACIGEQTTPPALGDVRFRAALLDHVGSAEPISGPVKFGVRYLLHGEPSRFSSDGTLWKDPSGQDSPWVRLWRMTTQDAWNVLPGELSARIPDKCSLGLDIRAVEQATVVARLRQATSFESVDASKFSEFDLDQILGRIDDELAWMRLPLHRDQRGEYGPVSGRCFLGGKPDLPQGIGQGLRFIVCSTDEVHSRRQSQFILTWNSSRAAEEVLRADGAGLHWRYLMDILLELSPMIAPAAVWTEVAWLPLAAGGLISPSSLIQLAGMDADISSLSARCEFAYAGLAELSDDLRAHPGFGRLRALAPSGARALPVLAALMANADLSVGASLANEPDLLQRHQALLCSLPSLPCWATIFKAIAATGIDDVSAHLLRDVARPLRTQQAELVLHDLVDRSLAPGERAVYLAYLREWANSASVDELRGRLADLMLLAADEKWQSAQNLVCGAPGIDAAHRLHPSVEEALHGIVARNDGLPPDAVSNVAAHDSEELSTALERWCEPLEQSSVRPAIGALIGLFGAGVQALAERWLAPITHETYIRQLAWKDPGYEDGPFPRKRWMGGHPTPAQPFTLLRPELIEASESTVRVAALTGDLILVPLASTDTMETLLAGPLNWLGGYGVEVRVRPVGNLHLFGLQRQKEILQQTAEDLWRGFYNQDHANLADLWSLFEDADQVELDIAQSLILEGLPQLMEQLSKVKRNPSIAAALANVDKGRRQIANAQRSKASLEDAYDRFKEALDALAKLVKTDSSVQSALLDGIRQKMTRYQYERSSIPFEILQNADDAVVEYQDMLRAEHRPLMPQADIGHFVIADTDQGLMLMHWGRPINYTGKHQSYRAEFAKDLERMLMLGASAKESEDGVTGKFGLGFKSVLLATDRPIVASGDLHFEIVAGCLPQRAELSPSGKSRAALYKRANLRSTVIELPLAEKASSAALMHRFVSLVGVCSVFTRQVKHIEVNGEPHSWTPDRLLEASAAWCELGQIQVPTKRGQVPTRLLTLRCNLGAVAVRLDGKAIQFDREADYPIPAIWVTEPTRGTAASGVLLNADFEIDTGRGSLPQGTASKRNHDLARKLAKSVAPVMGELIEKSSNDWLTWSSRLATTPQCSAADFWYAAWSVMFGEAISEDASQDVQLTSALIKELFGQVLDRTGVVPNGMPGSLSAFAAQTQLRLSINCSRLHSVLPALAAWPSFVSVYPLSAWCGEDVAAWIQGRSTPDEDCSIEELDRSSLMNALGPDRRLGAEQISDLASIIIAWPKGPTEEQGWRNELATIQLKSRSGAWRPAGHIFFDAPGEGNLLAQFAPEEVLLDEAYSAQQGAWQVICQYLSARAFQAQDLARWCLAAEEDRRHLVVKWLATNLDAWLVWHHIKTLHVADHWILGLHLSHPLFDGLEAGLRDVVLARLGLSTFGAVPDDYEQDLPATRLDVRAIRNWWVAHRDQYLQKYDQALWPHRIDRSKLADDGGIHRETWMTLFSLGVFRRFGRVRDEQNRAFLEFLHTRGWWITISEVHPDRGAEQWMNILREYAETNQVTGEFEQWMDSFPRLYRLARWCDDYVELFRGLQFRDKREARRLLTPATDASLNGSGFDAPTIHRTLRIGHNLVIRELLRIGVLSSDVAQSMAFMPGRAVLELLQQMGHTGLESSEDIYAMLVDELGDSDLVSFGGDYDIPLILLAGNPGLQQAVVDWTEEQDQLEFDSDALEEDSL